MTLLLAFSEVVAERGRVITLEDGGDSKASPPRLRCC
jgi:hypothetical protein